MIKKIIVIVVLLMMIGSMMVLLENNVNKINKDNNFYPFYTTYNFNITVSANPVVNGSNFYVNATGLIYIAGDYNNILLIINGNTVGEVHYTNSTFSFIVSLTANSTISMNSQVLNGNFVLIYNGNSNNINETIKSASKYNVEFITDIRNIYKLSINNNTYIQSNNLFLSFKNGTYTYKANAIGYYNLSGNFTVNGKNVSIYLNFTRLIEYIIFKESGYSGSFNIIVNGITYSSNNGSIYIIQPDYYFNYSYIVLIPNGFNVNKSNGSVYYNNNTDIVYVHFNKISVINYDVFIFIIFVITGLLIYLIYRRLE